jgi:tRNA G26 N,N-dimethylase Trm1
MTSLPLTFKVRNAVVEKHQLEGTDPSDRYFNRMVAVKRVERGYSASFMYEDLTVEGDTHKTVAAAVKEIVDKLRDLGFSGMRTRVNFKGQRYLAEKETWLDYPD